MSTAQSKQPCSAFSQSRPEQFLDVIRSPLSSGNTISSDGMDTADSEMQTRFGEQFQSSNIGITLDELKELRVFDEFLTQHVHQIRICDVQCMLLWNEWVRTFKRQSNKFPQLIREKEFRNVITDKFGILVVKDGARGDVYPGLRFVP